jgi:hypothetical protein
MDQKGQTDSTKSLSLKNRSGEVVDFVLDKAIFARVFEKDVRRVYVYKKCERIAKALHLITPAFKDAKILRDRLQKAGVELIDASSRPITESRETLSRELLTLSSILSMARSSQLLSPMNAEVIGREIHALLQDIAAYEDPRLALEEVPSLASISKALPKPTMSETRVQTPAPRPAKINKGHSQGQPKQVKDTSSRKDSILSILTSKGPSHIKEISTLIRNVSEKTIQRELQTLVQEGKVTKTGERRWTIYALKA